MDADQRLDAYRRKRRTELSGEPTGADGPPPRDGQPRFVVHDRSGDRERPYLLCLEASSRQRHDARSLHFDVRLEVDGVLVSWAVPKGPSLNPADKRLAHRTEDHPLDYIDFEGRIGGGYGAGTVIVWDTGTYDNLTTLDGEPVAAADALLKGHIKVQLYGHKLSGAFAVTHTKMGGDEANWMLVKVDDESADRRRRPTATQNESVLTGRTNSDLEAD
jgi:DNA ligase D-like protein (predicted 3'-phosphoesterase)